MDSLCIIFLSLCLSLALLHHIYSCLPPPPLSLDSISPDNEGMIQLSLVYCLDQGASVYLSTVCEWCLTRTLQMQLKEECWCTLVSVQYEIRKVLHLELMNKLKEACVTAQRGTVLSFLSDNKGDAACRHHSLSLSFSLHCTHLPPRLHGMSSIYYTHTHTRSCFAMWAAACHVTEGPVGSRTLTLRSA